MKKKKAYNWWAVEIESPDRNYLYCIGTLITDSLGNEMETAKRMAVEKHNRLYPDMPIVGNTILGHVRSFFAQKQDGGNQ